MKAEFGLSLQDTEKLRSVLRRFPQVESAIVYGSRAKGNFRPGSDIDLTLTGPELSNALLADIATQMDDLLLPYMIDLSIQEMIDHEDLRAHIKRVGKVLYRASSSDAPE